METLNNTTLKRLRTISNNLFSLAQLGEQQHQAKEDRELLKQFDIKFGNCTYDPNGLATFKVEFKIKGTDSRELRDLKAFAKLYNLDINKENPTYKIIGYRRRARKNPFVMEDKRNGKHYVISKENAQELFGKKEKVA
jgi:hypothetical protein|tara:strand:- start:3378 stop:3791 length:414 start_codon:yes stop_codon:yes gene_type:complete